MQIIRSRTRELHTRLEATVELESSLSSLSTYCALLHRYLHLYRPFEASLARQSGKSQELISTLYRSKVPLLEADLRALHCASEQVLFDPPALPCVEDNDSLLGVLYVTEGSALGGQFIYRELQRLLNLDADSGAGFFYGDGPATGARWKQFTSVLNEQVIDAERAADAACAMFQVFEAGLGGTQ